MRDDDEFVVLVDSDDRDIGVERKLAAHRLGHRHRAISVFLRDRDGRTLLQRRAQTKYHSPGLWANACCGHPRRGETPKMAAERRLRDELGLTAPLRAMGRISYRASLPNQLIENEIVHLFVGSTDEDPLPNPEEVSEWKWVAANEIELALLESPKKFAAWFRIYAARIPEVVLWKTGS